MIDEWVPKEYRHKLIYTRTPTFLYDSHTYELINQYVAGSVSSVHNIHIGNVNTYVRDEFPFLKGFITCNRIIYYEAEQTQCRLLLI